MSVPSSVDNDDDDLLVFDFNYADNGDDSDDHFYGISTTSRAENDVTLSKSSTSTTSSHR